MLWACGVIRFEADGFLILADGLVGLAFLDEGDAEVVVGVGVIRFEADGFLVLADGLVDLAFLAEGGAEVVVGIGVIRFEADGFLKLADRLLGLAFLKEGVAEVVVRDVIILRDFERMTEKGLTVLPITKLLPRQRHAENHCRRTRQRQPNRMMPPAPRQFMRAPDGHNQNPHRRNISVTIRHRLFAHLHQANHGHQRPDKPQPAHQQKGMAPPLHKQKRRKAA